MFELMDTQIDAIEALSSLRLAPDLLDSFRPEPALAAALGVAEENVLAGSRLLERVTQHFSRSARHVIVAEPTDPRVLDAVLESGARYADAGRNHRFFIAADGWRSLLCDERTGMAYLAHPDEPTGRSPERQRTDEAIQAGVPLLVDRRFCLSPPPADVEDGVLSLCSFHARAGLPQVEFLVGTAGMLDSIRGHKPLEPAEIAGLCAVLRHSDQTEQRVQRWKARLGALYEALNGMAGVVVEPPGGLSLWVRVPGVQSARIAEVAAHPLIEGSSAWTWRDAVRITPPAFEQQSALLACLCRAL